MRSITVVVAIVLGSAVVGCSSHHHRDPDECEEPRVICPPPPSHGHYSYGRYEDRRGYARHDERDGRGWRGDYRW
jgi:hypothetical protein